MINNIDSALSIAQQCEMANVSRSSYYASLKPCSSNDKEAKDLINAFYVRRPSFVSRRIAENIRRYGVPMNRKRVQRLMREMNIYGVCPKRNLSKANIQHKKYPYIARDKPITSINQVWSTDITYINTLFGTVYLVAIIDWHSRLILSWGMSNTMGEEFCIEALHKALLKDIPKIFNTDQGPQFTGNHFNQVLLDHNIKPSMDGKGRATDNAPIERFWRSVKWEEVYLYEPVSYLELQEKINAYIKFYNHERPHQSINYKTPSECHFDLEKKSIDTNYEFIYTDKELKYMEKG